MESSFCAELSAMAGESLIATAPACTTVWILVEHEGPWASKPLRSPGFSDDVRVCLKKWLKAIPDSRLQLIRQPNKKKDPHKKSLMVAYASEDISFVFSLEIESYEDLLGIDLPSIVREKKEGKISDKSSLPLVLVCTHGKRDRCCAKWGLPFYQVLEKLDLPNVWQTSHLGGHRFAATAVVLPLGYCYGRLELHHVEEFARSVQTRKLFLPENFRGLVYYPSHVQAAHAFLKKHIPNDLFVELSLKESVEFHRGQWKVVFEASEGRVFAVITQKKTSLTCSPSSCFDELKSFVRWQSSLSSS